jgi:hypothetical protein
MSATSSARNVVTIDTEPPAPRGRYLARWGARVIEQDKLAIVEFVDNPWYTENARRRDARLSTLQRALAALKLV